ncbi:MAG: hypothetical protein E6H56_09715 [Betaproteobacteria bacterium]|nr:MAG: hypothetical protein E6H56_09715 [Betaproteobacteria bacterium]
MILALSVLANIGLGFFLYVRSTEVALLRDEANARRDERDFLLALMPELKPHISVADQAGVARGGEVRAEKEIAVSVHDVQGGAAAGAFGERPDDGRVERLGEIVVPGPVLEQVAENVEALRAARCASEEFEEDAIDLRPRCTQVQIGDEENCQRTSRRLQPAG